MQVTQVFVQCHTFLIKFTNGNKMKKGALKIDKRCISETKKHDHFIGDRCIHYFTPS